jgi:uncharacterized membrane protein
MSDNSSLFLFAVIMITQLTFIGIWLQYFLFEMRTTIKARLPRIYFMMCLCNNTKRAEREELVSHMQHRYKEVIIEIENVLKCKDTLYTYTCDC